MRGPSVDVFTETRLIVSIRISVDKRVWAQLYFGITESPSSRVVS